jgi:predicted GNAT family N-acyltransferase
VGATGEIVVSEADDVASFRAVVELRRIVFGNEQRILLPRYEDPEDEFSLNLLATIDGIPVGTGRLTPAYDRVMVPTIAWVATLREYRGRGVGSAIMRELVADADARGFDKIYLNAQSHALGMYQGIGFEPVGSPQMIHNIPHQAMLRMNRAAYRDR